MLSSITSTFFVASMQFYCQTHNLHYFCRFKDELETFCKACQLLKWRLKTSWWIRRGRDNASSIYLINHEFAIATRGCLCHICNVLNHILNDDTKRLNHQQRMRLSCLWNLKVFKMRSDKYCRWFSCLWLPFRVVSICNISQGISCKLLITLSTIFIYHYIYKYIYMCISRVNN